MMKKLLLEQCSQVSAGTVNIYFDYEINYEFELKNCADTETVLGLVNDKISETSQFLPSSLNDNENDYYITIMIDVAESN